MLDLKTADITQTRFYRDVFQLGRQEGEQKGRQEGEAKLIIRQLKRRFGVMTPNQETQIRTLSVPMLEALGEVLLDFINPTDIDTWLSNQENLK
jgi:predicted transposase YdaD